MTIEEKIRHQLDLLKADLKAEEFFRKGVNLGYTQANKWISVEEELPPISKRGIKNRPIKYLVKCTKENPEQIGLSEYTKYGWENCSGVIAWRPIETI